MINYTAKVKYLSSGFYLFEAFGIQWPPSELNLKIRLRRLWLMSTYIYKYTDSCSLFTRVFWIVPWKARLHKSSKSAVQCADFVSLQAKFRANNDNRFTTRTSNYDDWLLFCQVVSRQIYYTAHIKERKFGVGLEVGGRLRSRVLIDDLRPRPAGGERRTVQKCFLWLPAMTSKLSLANCKI